MSLGFLLPAAFAALIVLALPLLVHLARRSEQRPTDFAALRWLREHPKPRHRLSIDEILLLVLRLLLLALVVLWLARPVLFGSADRSPWVVVMPGVDPRGLRADNTSEVRWLAPGFPAIDRPAPIAAPPFASLLRELDAELPAGLPLSVVVPGQLQGADAERPRLSRAVAWRVAPGAMAVQKVARVTAPSLTVRHDAGRDGGLRYIRAAALAMRSPGFTVGLADEPLPPGATSLVWLSSKPLPGAVRAWVAKGGTVLLVAEVAAARSKTSATFWRDDEGMPLVEGWKVGRGRVLRFTRALRPDVMPEVLEAEFPSRLRESLVDTPSPSRVMARDYAPVMGGEAPGRAVRDLQGWLAVLVAGLLLIERWVATRRSRGVAP